MAIEQQIAQMEYKVRRFKSALFGTFTLLGVFSGLVVRLLPLSFLERQIYSALAFVLFVSLYFLLLRHIEWDAKRRI